MRPVATIDAEGGNLRQITRGTGNNLYPSWSRDGAWIYFSKTGNTGPNIWRIAVEGGRKEQITQGGGYIGFESADGKSLLYTPRFDRRGTPLLKTSLTGGSPGQFIDCTYGFSVSSKGIFYYPCRRGAPALSPINWEPLDLRLIDPATDGQRLIGRLEDVEDPFWGPSASPDGSTVLYARTANRGEDLMLIENFR